MTRRAFLGSFGVVTSTVTWPVHESAAFTTNEQGAVLNTAANRQHFVTSAGGSTQPGSGCAPAFIIATGNLTQDAQSDSFAVGTGLALLPHPDTMAVKRLEQFIGDSVEVIIRPIR